MKDDKQYEGLRKKGMSKSRAAAIATPRDRRVAAARNRVGRGEQEQPSQGGTASRRRPPAARAARLPRKVLTCGDDVRAFNCTGIPRRPSRRRRSPSRSRSRRAARPRCSRSPITARRATSATGGSTDKAALITGADSGSAAPWRSPSRARAPTSLCSYWNEDEDAAETQRLVEDAGRRCVTVPGDIGDREHCRALVDRAVAELGRLDVLVNNAAFQMAYDSFLEIPPDELDFVFRTNVLAMFHLCQAAVPKMEPARRS